MPAIMAETPHRPIVTWTPPRLAEDQPRRGRSAGAAAGFLVAALYALAAGPGAPADLNFLAVPTLLAGTIGGWLFGPTAWTAHRDADWLRSIAGLGVVALLIGALATGVSIGILAAVAGGLSIGEAVELIWAMTLLAATIGLIFPGLFMLPITVASAAVWAMIMVLYRAWAAPDER